MPETDDTPTITAPTAGPRRRTTGRLVAAIAGLSLVLGLMLAAFALPAANSGPHDLALGVTGPAAQIERATRTIEQAAPGAYAFTVYPDGRQLRDAIEHRDEAGGLALGARPTVLIASGGGTPIAQGLRTVAVALGEQTGQVVAVEDLAPYTAGDPMGGAIGAVGLPLILAGVLSAVLLSRLLPRRPGLRVGGALGFAVVGGLLVGAVLVLVTGTADGGLLRVAGAAALGIAAISLAALGMHALFGIAGLGAITVTMMLIGNPLSGIATAPALLPGAWGTVGQLLPPGATGTLLRSTAFFDGHGAGTAGVVLAGWALLGLALTVLAARRTPGRQQRAPAAVTPAR